MGWNQREEGKGAVVWVGNLNNQNAPELNTEQAKMLDQRLEGFSQSGPIHASLLSSPILDQTMLEDW